MSDEAIEVRAATLSDAAALAQVHVEGWRWGYRGLVPQAALDALDEGARRAQWEAVLRGDFPEADVWVATRGGAVQGFVAGGPARDDDADDDAGELFAFYVREAAAGTGVAAALLRAASAGLKARGGARVLLWVRHDAARARRFFEREGLRADGAEKLAPWPEGERRELRYRGAL